MGNKFEVEVFTLDNGYETYWRGDSLFGLIGKVYDAKKFGCKCIRIYYRP